MTYARLFLTADHGLRGPWVILAAAFGSVLLILVVLQIATSVDNLTSAYLEANDNRTWVVAQLSVEYQRLQLAVAYAESAGASAEALEAVRVRFDIYQSRLIVVTDALKQVAMTQRLDQVLRLLHLAAERGSGLVEAVRPGDVKGLTELLVILKSDDAVVRKVPSLALEAFSAQAESVRKDVNLALNQSISLIIGLFVALSVALTLLYSSTVKLRMKAHRLDRLSANLRTTLDASPDATIITDMAGLVTGMNKAALAMFGLTGKTLMDVSLSDIVEQHFDLNAAVDGAERRTEALPVLRIGERRRMQAKNMLGRRFAVEVSSSGGESAEGEGMMIYFLRDLTEQDADNAALLAARDQARMDASAKDRFIAVMSHEMRTPLSGVIASLDLLREERDQGERDFLIKTARSCSITSLKQIEDVLELARSGYYTEPAQLMDPAAIAIAVVDELKSLADLRGNRFQIDVGDLPRALQVCGLPRTYRLVLNNLVANSIKFTENGLIRIEIAMTPLGNGDVLLRTKVQDNGIGIAPVDQVRIFEAFEVVHEINQATRPTGSGLGLAIVKSGVTQMGSTIMLESTPGKGSAFWFEIKLPSVVVTSVPAEVPLSMSLSVRPRRVLVVDDNLVNQALLSRMVVRLGHEVDLANDGPTAVALAALTPFDLILMDINLPGFDGLEAARQIRVAGASKAAVIIGITAQILAKHRERMEFVEMNRLISKPITLNQLAQLFEEVFATIRSPPLVTDNSKDWTELQVLLGDDLLRRLLVSCLHDAALALTCWPTSAADQIEQMFRTNLHRALGSAAVLCEVRLHSVLNEAEDAAHADDVIRLVNLRKIAADHINSLRQRLPVNTNLDDVIIGN